MDAFSIDIGDVGILEGVTVAIVEIGPFENGEVCEDREEKLVWKSED